MTRSWCAVCRYPGLAEFLAGTVHTPRGDGEEAARAAMAALLATMLPPGVEIVAMRPGALFFSDDDL